MPKLSPDQGPPLSIPMSFFLSAPVSLSAAGLLLLVRADDGIATSFAQSNVALVHLGALGFLLFVIAGAMYQLLPVAAGALVPFVRLAHLVHALLVAGTGALVLAQWQLLPRLFAYGSGLLGAAFLLWLAPSAHALAKSRMSHPTAWGLRLAIASILAAATLGLRMAMARAGIDLPGDFLTIRMTHAALGPIVFVGGLIASVSWQVIPMFFLAAQPPRWLPKVVMAGVLASLIGLVIMAFFAVPSWAVTIAAAPAAIAVWLIQPAWTARALRARKRKRPDATLLGWWISIALSPLCLVAGAIAGLSDRPTPPIVWGVLVLWGQAGLLVHAMLTRIVPFLVYLHKSAPLVATHRVRSAKELLPDREVRIGVAIHAASLILGLFAAFSASNVWWQTFGVSLLVTAAFLTFELIAAWQRGRTPISRRAAPS
ncbi:MAG: hypothetical protein HYV07_29135 [Deltaproteobacteria bacterium]|nr:hypothetical protein [Deltaproteobacteria bacterium]